MSKEATTEQNSAATVKLMAERKMGELLKGMGMGSGSHKQKSRGGTFGLADLGLTRNESSRYQIENLVPTDLHNAMPLPIICTKPSDTLASYYRRHSTKRDEGATRGRTTHKRFSRNAHTRSRCLPIWLLAYHRGQPCEAGGRSHPA